MAHEMTMMMMSERGPRKLRRMIAAVLTAARCSRAARASPWRGRRRAAGVRRRASRGRPQFRPDTGPNAVASGDFNRDNKPRPRWRTAPATDVSVLLGDGAVELRRGGQRRRAANAPATSSPGLQQ